MAEKDQIALDYCDRLKNSEDFKWFMKELTWVFENHKNLLFKCENFERYLKVMGYLEGLDKTVTLLDSIMLTAKQNIEQEQKK